jgi:alpha-glucosidase
MSVTVTGARYAGADHEGARWDVGDATLQLSAVSSGVAQVRLIVGDASWEEAVAAPRHAPASIASKEGRWTVQLDGLRVTLQGAPLSLDWEVDGNAFLADHPTHAYVLRGSGLTHRQVRADGERLYGVGEVSGALERTGRRYRLDPRDALGYDAELGDPLYKHWPVLLLRRPEGRWAALVYDMPFPMVFDLGAEIHNYLGPFRYVEAGGRGLTYYVLVAPDLPALLRRLTGLLGRPQLPPRWSLGYLASGMAYADADDPEAALIAFADRCEREGIPVDGMHLSSGYTLRQGRRYVFTWSDRIADPRGLVARMAERGLRVVANVKPGMLEDHPDYASLSEHGAFLRTAEGTLHHGDFWGGAGSFLDFTNEVATRYWRERVTTQLLDIGIEGIWNDNNEFALEDAFTAGGEPAHPASQMRAMALASYRACEAARPQRRPFVISRSASLGVQRLAQTWSGDNRSDWRSLHFNTPMGLSLGLSGFANNGHDVGGFAGPAPDAELFLRWVQQGVFFPRFVIHSWKTPPTEPWSHPEVLPAVREALRLRYRLLPYLYSLFFEHGETGAPVMRPLFYAFDTPEAYEQPFSFLLGPDVLVPGEAFGPGVREAETLLPGEQGWYRLQDAHYYPSGRLVVPYPLEAAPAFVRAGAILPLGFAPDGRALRDASVAELRIYPHPGEGTTTFRLYADDGESLAYQRGERTLLDLRVSYDAGAIMVEAEVLEHRYPLPDHSVTLRLPAGETRPLRLGAGLSAAGEETEHEGWRELPTRWDLPT